MSFTRLLSTSAGAATAGLAGATVFGDTNRRKSSLSQAPESDASPALTASNTSSLEQIDSNSSALERIDSSASERKDAATSETRSPDAPLLVAEKKPGVL